jgi:hypothetical protein
MRDGRASSEFIRQNYSLELSALEGTVAGVTYHEQTHEEFAVLDRFGRMQLPQAFTDTLGKNRKVKVTVEEGQVIVSKIAQ